MKIGIIGLPRSGKTSLFTALVGESLRKEEYPSHKFVLSLGTIKLEDKRLVHLGEVFDSKKITFAEITLVDVSLFGETENRWFESSLFREMDFLVGVLKCFSPSPEPLKEIRFIEEELVLEDLESVQNRIKRLEEELRKGKREGERELSLLKKINHHLEEGEALRNLNFDSQEDKLIRGFKFLTQKPIFFVLNLDEKISYSQRVEIEKILISRGYRFIPASLKLELELTLLEEREREAFLESLGFKESVRVRFIFACQSYLGLITFFTVKGEEAKAWLIDKATPALKAAGRIHSDMERGFVRAEVINYADFIKVDSSLSEARKGGLLRLESKEYLFKDGDIVDFRFAI